MTEYSFSMINPPKPIGISKRVRTSFLGRQSQFRDAGVELNRVHRVVHCAEVLTYVTVTFCGLPMPRFPSYSFEVTTIVYSPGARNGNGAVNSLGSPV